MASCTSPSASQDKQKLVLVPSEKKRKRQEAPCGTQSIALEEEQNDRRPLVMAWEDPCIQLHPWCVTKELVDGCESGDLLLICKNNRAVRCHSQVLAFCSRVLKDMLEGTGLCKGCTAENPAQLHVTDDSAEHWMYALMFIYPLIKPPPGPNFANAAALALLSHKYNIPRVAGVWEQFVFRVTSEDPSVGHFTWIITDWESDKFEPTINSDPFEAAGYSWTLTMYPTGDGNDEDDENGPAPPHVGIFLFLNSTDDPLPSPTVSFHGTVVSQSQPTLSNLSQSMGPTLFSRDEDSGYGWPNFMSLDALEDESKGFIVDNTLEFQVVIQVHSPVPPVDGTRYVLSSDQKDEAYVFKWLELAKTIEDDKLAQKCLDFLGKNSFRGMSDSTFRQRLKECIRLLDPEQIVHLIRSSRDHC